MLVFTQALVTAFTLLPVKTFLNFLHSSFKRVCEMLDDFEAAYMPQICFYLAIYATHFLEKDTTELILVHRSIDKAFETAMEGAAGLSLANLKLYLKSAHECEID